MMQQKMRNNPKIRDESDKPYFATSDESRANLDAEKAKLAGDLAQDFATKNLSSSAEIRGPKAKMTVEGGIAIKLINNTGQVSAKGYVVYSDKTVDFAVNLAVTNTANPVGVFYESGVANGEEAWVVVSGIADVYFADKVTRGQWARGLTSSDAVYAAGQAIAQDTKELASLNDNDFPIYYSDIDCVNYYKIGYALESNDGAGLARCVLHFN